MPAAARDSKLRIALYALEMYSLIAGEFVIKDRAPSPDQSPSEAGRAGDSLRLDENGEFDFRVAGSSRAGSRSVADWLNAQCDTSRCTTLGRRAAAGELSFAVIGTLRLTVSYKRRRTYTVAFDDILIARGHERGRAGWWFGGKACSRVGAAAASRGGLEAVGATEAGHRFRFAFQRRAQQSGGDARALVAVTGISLLTWMKGIEDDRPVNHIDIPGTHDSATYNFNALIFSNYVRTQNLTIRQQLDLGVRFLDIRCRHVNNSFQIYHGDYYVHLSFDDVLRQGVSFLRENPSESIVMLVKEEGRPKWNNGAFYETFLDYVASTSEYWYRGQRIPSMRDARGKFVLMYRFDFDKGFFGIDCNEWSDNASFEIQRRGFTLSIQDKYDVSFAEKKRSIRALADSSKQRKSQYWYVNYSSLAPSFARGTIIDTSNYTNKVVHEIATAQPRSFLGLVVMDYPNIRNGLVSEIIDNNEHLQVDQRTKNQK